MKKMRLVALVILVPGRASNSATVSSCAGSTFCIYKMRLVALIMLVAGRGSNLATVSREAAKDGSDTSGMRRLMMG